jgi:hypothetical protein
VQPLVVTLLLDAEAQQRFDGLRERHFPADRNHLAAHVTLSWAPWLTRQDAQWRHPHVTVQNKVAPEVARGLHADLAADFTPYGVPAVGLGLWRYLGGPWEPVERYLF